MTIARLYYECHVTVEPVFDERLAKFKELCIPFHFIPADLLMQKREEDTPERSAKDTFATLRERDYDTTVELMTRFIQTLRAAGFKVWRYKVEDTLLDSRPERDPLGLLI